MANSCTKIIKAESGEMKVHICSMLDSCECNKNCNCRNKEKMKQGD